MTKRLGALIGSVLMLATSFFSASPASAQSWQCAPYARMISGIELFGNAGTWWGQAEGKYARGHTPQPGAVIVLKAYGAMRVGHVATVSQVVDARTIKVTHANWSVIHGMRGQIERDVTVVDASAAGDWSKVRVWFASMHDVGMTAYPAYGFIYKDEPKLQMAAATQDDAPIQLASAAR